MTYPEEFLQRIKDSNNKWFVVDDKLQFETLLLEDTKLIADTTGKVYMVGIKQDNYTYVYMEIKSMVYVPTTNKQSDYFTINVQSGTFSKQYKLMNINSIDGNIGTEVVTNKLEKCVHLFKGVEGPAGAKGKNGASSYEMWSRRYPGVSQEVFLKSLNTAYELGRDRQTYNAELAAMKEQINMLQALIKSVAEEIPIGALMYSHNNPNEKLWLPFGFRDTVYFDRDYPELAKIVKSWGGDFVVDDDRFRLGDSSNINRYIYCAGGDRPAGTLTSSQLPNGTNTTAFGNSLGMNAYIKAKQILTYV